MMAIVRDVSKLKHLLELFPFRNEISYCFAYGSAIFEQKLTPKRIEVKEEVLVDQTIERNNEKFSASSLPPKRKMIDLVVAVNNPAEWHRENLLKNWSHYSGLRYLGPSWITKIQKNFGAKIFYNTLIPIGNDYIKYGVISTQDLINDLLDWETFYISGRLHKPTLVLQEHDTNVELQNALKMNIQSALHVALLLLQETFTEEELFMIIAGLSYSGDFRMTFGEDKNKVAKIVRPQIENFRKIYMPLLNGDLFQDLVKPSSKGEDHFVQNCSTAAVQWHLNLLPKTVQLCLSKEWIAANTPSGRLRNSVHLLDLDDLMRRVAFDITYRTFVRKAIETIVFRSSSTQSIKGLFTAGLSKSITYSSEKVQKMFQ